MDAKKTTLNLIFCSFFPFYLLMIALFAGCESASKTEQTVDKVAGQISEQIAEQTNRLNELIPSRSEIQKSSNEQIEKIFLIEYKVVDLKADQTGEQVQTVLSDLGKDRWDCFSLTPNLDASRLICKRRPISALRTLSGAGGLLW